MANIAVKAEDLGIYVNDILVACAQTASLTINREYLDAVCAGTGAWSEKAPGIMSWEGSIDALWRVIATADAATNVDARNIFDALVAGTQFEMRFGYRDGSAGTLNGFQLTGQAYWTSLALNNPSDDNQTWTADFTGTGPLTRIAVPA